MPSNNNPIKDEHSHCAHSHLLNASKNIDPKIHGLLLQNGPVVCKPKLATELFDFLARTVIGKCSKHDMVETERPFQ